MVKLEMRKEESLELRFKLAQKEKKREYFQKKFLVFQEITPCTFQANKVHPFSFAGLADSEGYVYN